ncbi:twin-arginine translocase TatA/TatE family subunit [Mycetocola saprophilus]|uniref:twin-arginine translocase TatA/TatE family subunit n=1 Tax=Mycetocola saprophilus TaxID=76636 RepID=UPI0004C1CA19|nr:twin-arginine translocase TatA/TatE family subunit [Mycetocola saprophilus]
MLANLSGWHMIALVAIVLLLFGAPRLPALARSLGQSARILKTEIREAPATQSDVETAAEPADSAPFAEPSAPGAVRPKPTHNR